MSADEKAGVAEYCRGYRDGFAQGMEHGANVAKTFIPGWIAQTVEDAGDADKAKAEVEP